MPVKAIPVAAAVASSTAAATTAAATTSWLTYASLAASAAGTAATVTGMGGQSRGYDTAAEYNAQIRERNEKVAKQQADYRRLIGGIQVVDFREQFRRQIEGATTVAFAKANVQGDTGTARLIMEENAREADQEIAAIKMQAENDAMGFQEKAVNEGMAANLERLYARNMRSSTRYRQMAAVVSGASKFGSLLADA